MVSLSPLSVLPDSLLVSLVESPLSVELESVLSSVVSLVVSLVSVVPESVPSPELDSVVPVSLELSDELLVRVAHSVIELHVL